MILSPEDILRLRTVILCLVKLITRILKPYIYPSPNHLITTCPTVAGPLDFGSWMSRYRMRLCRACFGIRANFPSIPFNTTYPTTDDNFYLIYSFSNSQNDKSRYSDLSYLLIWSNRSFISSLPLCLECSLSCCVVAWDLPLHSITSSNIKFS